MEFLYTDNFDHYMSYLSQPAEEGLCKHVLRNVNNKTRNLVTASEAIDYHHVWWGYGQNLHTDPERNRLINIGIIQKIIYDCHIHPVRLVIDREGWLWADNLHNTIANILCRESGVSFLSMPVYIVDMRGPIPKIADKYHVVDLDREKLKGLLIVSQNRINRVSPQIRKVNYTIREFMNDNDINIGALTLSDFTYYEEFIRKGDKMIRHI